MGVCRCSDPTHTCTQRGMHSQGRTGVISYLRPAWHSASHRRLPGRPWPMQAAACGQDHGVHANSMRPRPAWQLDDGHHAGADPIQAHGGMGCVVMRGGPAARWACARTWWHPPPPPRPCAVATARTCLAMLPPQAGRQVPPAAHVCGVCLRCCCCCCCTGCAQEVRVHGAAGWSFDFTIRPSSDPALWDKYGSVPAGVQVRHRGAPHSRRPDARAGRGRACPETSVLGLGAYLRGLLGLSQPVTLHWTTHAMRVYLRAQHP